MPSDTPTEGRCNYEYTADDDYDPNSGYCESHPMDNGRCFHHGGKKENGGPPEDNSNAAKAGAWADSFYQDFLTDEEQRRVDEAADIMGSQAGAQEIGRHVASLALEQFRRTGDERFIRRFESICDKFSIAPAEELDVSTEVDVNHDVDEDTKEMLSQLFDRDVQNS